MMLELCPWQVSYLGLEESVDNDPCKFVLSCRGSSERFTLQAANVDIKQVWVRHIQVLLDDQSKFLYGEDMPRVQRSAILIRTHRECSYSLCVRSQRSSRPSSTRRTRSEQEAAPR